MSYRYSFIIAVVYNVFKAAQGWLLKSSALIAGKLSSVRRCPDTNKAISISLWETKADLDAHVAAGRSVWGTQADLDAHVAAGRVPQHHVEAANALTAPYVEEFYEVSFQE